MKSPLLGLLLLLGCTNQCYPEANYPNYTQYPVTVTATTPGGISLDDPGRQLDPGRVDRTVRRVVACLADLKTVPLSAEERSEAQCYGTPTLEVRTCLVVKVAPDWRVSKCTQEEVFPCSVPFASCAEKGFVSDPECPCACRAMLQDNTVVVITPNMKLLPAYITTLLTGCSRPWTEHLAPCSNPALAGD